MVSAFFRDHINHISQYIEQYITHSYSKHILNIRWTYIEHHWSSLKIHWKCITSNYSDIALWCIMTQLYSLITMIIPWFSVHFDPFLLVSSCAIRTTSRRCSAASSSFICASPLRLRSTWATILDEIKRKMAIDDLMNGCFGDDGLFGNDGLFPNSRFPYEWFIWIFLQMKQLDPNGSLHMGKWWSTFRFCLPQATVWKLQEVDRTYMEICKPGWQVPTLHPICNNHCSLQSLRCAGVV